MSRCSVKCNEIKERIDNISGFSDDFSFGLLCIVEDILDFIDFYFEE